MVCSLGLAGIVGFLERDHADRLMELRWTGSLSDGAAKTAPSPRPFGAEPFEALMQKPDRISPPQPTLQISADELAEQVDILSKILPEILERILVQLGALCRDDVCGGNRPQQIEADLYV
jgi:hypothetical protein